MFLTKDALRAIQDLPTEIVEVPEWGEGAKVLVSGLSKNAMTALRESCTTTTKDEKGAETKALDNQALQDAITLACLTEPKLETEDLAWLYEKASAPVERIQLAAIRVSGLSPKAVEEAKSPSPS